MGGARLLSIDVPRPGRSPEKWYLESQVEAIAISLRTRTTGHHQVNGETYLSQGAVRRELGISRQALDGLEMAGKVAVARVPNKLGAGREKQAWRESELRHYLSEHTIKFDGRYADRHINLARASREFGLAGGFLKKYIKRGKLPSVKQQPPRGAAGPAKSTPFCRPMCGS